MPFGNAVGEGFNNSQFLRAIQVIISGANPKEGLFVYSGIAGPGNPPIFAVVPPGITVDPYGNSVSSVVQMGSATSSHISVDQFGEMLVWNSLGQLTMFLQPSLEAFSIYNPPAGAGQLAETIAAVGGTDNFANHILTGHSSYGTAISANLSAGVVNFYNGSQSGGWTLQATMQVDSLGDLLIATTGSGTIQLASPVVMGSTAVVNGTLTVQSDTTVNSANLNVGSGTNANINLNPKMATPPNAAAVAAGTATLSQLNAFCNGLYTSMRNRGMFN